jgi:hypothetical protein
LRYEKDKEINPGESAGHQYDTAIEGEAAEADQVELAHAAFPNDSIRVVLPSHPTSLFGMIVLPVCLDVPPLFPLPSYHRAEIMIAFSLVFGLLISL